MPWKKRGRAKKQRAGCLWCKPHKMNGVDHRPLIEQRRDTEEARERMSRTTKGSKPPGWDYWGKRPLGHHALVRGTKNKRLGIKRERRILNRAAMNEEGQRHVMTHAEGPVSRESGHAPVNGPRGLT